MNAPEADANKPPELPNNKRWRVLSLLALLFGLIAVGVGGYWNGYGRWYVSTDNALSLIHI